MDEDLGLLIVADGMGGHAAGEVASRLAVEAVVGFIRRTSEDQEHSWPYGIDSGLSFNANRLRTAVHLANRRVFREAENHDDYTGMGTTIVAALVLDGTALDRPRRRQPDVLRVQRPAGPADARRLVGGDRARPGTARRRASRPNSIRCGTC